MFCRKCGTQSSENTTTCIACGATLDNPYDPSRTFAAGPTASQTDKPSSYLAQSITVTLCCCLPLGIVGIVYAAQVDSKWNAGDFVGANLAAANAKKWTLIGFGLGVVLNGLLMLGQLAAIGTAIQQQNAQQQGQGN